MSNAELNTAMGYLAGNMTNTIRMSNPFFSGTQTTGASGMTMQTIAKVNVVWWLLFGSDACHVLGLLDRNRNYESEDGGNAVEVERFGELLSSVGAGWQGEFAEGTRAKGVGEVGGGGASERGDDGEGIPPDMRQSSQTS